MSAATTKTIQVDATAAAAATAPATAAADAPATAAAAPAVAAKRIKKKGKAADLKDGPMVVVDSTSNDKTMKFTLSNVNVSYANAIRRTILSDIPTVVFDKIEMKKNTTRLNNELIKQRLRCIPIYVADTAMESFLKSNARVEIDTKNISDTITYVTTADFKYAIGASEAGAGASEAGAGADEAGADEAGADEAAAAADAAAPAPAAAPLYKIADLFPPFRGQHFIDIARLRPPVSGTTGDELHFTAGFKSATAKEDNSYNVASTCSYGYTVDSKKQAAAWEVEEAKVKSDLSEADLKFHKRDWDLLDGKRFFMTDEHNEPNSFDFIIETVGPFTNEDIFRTASFILKTELLQFKTLLTRTKIAINTPITTMDDCYDVHLWIPDTWGAGYTIGKVLEAELHKLYILDPQDPAQKLTFCAFRKPHPHIDDCYLRLAGQKQPNIIEMLQQAADNAITTISLIMKHRQPESLNV